MSSRVLPEDTQSFSECYVVPVDILKLNMLILFFVKSLKILCCFQYG